MKIKIKKEVIFLLKVMLAQMKPVLFDKTINLQKMERYIQVASKENADLILFPELALTGYFTRDKTISLAEDLEGKSIKLLQSWARDYNIKVITGFPEVKGDSVYNSAIFINNDGMIIGTYQKCHLWDEEYKYFQPGNSYPIWETDIGKIGIMICYDTEFPEVARTLALKGAQLIFAPTANMSPLEHSQRIYIQARAVENQIFVATTNRVGIEEDTHFFGESAAADPFGRFLTLGEDKEEHYFVEINLERISEARENFFYLKDRAVQTYNTISKISDKPITK
ncbi:carbon-nitrogen hydrolase family protein [Pseudalkalibacillus caeni]|uniref:Carbon-nitrogen hydrolase family protein n=1 Tax=Exobacillus caeni TaxID=2574798 RepID=A0A5R9FAD5_9BACL|nr:carbon-nitrogen hydrolase family protein [Pseudalkalibacillus caeni]TLS38618.1 carbon-nitrogen hydrolase family protein [Pseudalkalibacillus caeni]